LPRFQKLYEKYKNRPGVMVVSMNLDENPGVIQPFMDENKYTFPVLFAYKYGRETMKIMATPTNWIVDGGAVAHLELLGGGPESIKKWELGMSEVLPKNHTTVAQATSHRSSQ
jgi:hypothetical protein